MKTKIVLAIVVATFSAGAAFATYSTLQPHTHEHGKTIGATQHSGGTDKYGCHTNHKTGDYHCH